MRFIADCGTFVLRVTAQNDYLKYTAWCVYVDIS